MSKKGNIKKKSSDNKNDWHISLNKRDIILVATILILSLCTFAGYRFLYRDAGNTVRIEVNGKLYKELPLNKNTEITIKGAGGGTNRLRIHNGYADMTDADCPDKLCVRQKKISSSGETIVCLPHKVVVTVITDDKGNLDGVAS